MAYGWEPKDVQTLLKQQAQRPRAVPPPVTMKPDRFLALIQAHGLPLPQTEFKFAEAIGRKFRADYCWPAAMVIVERNGGIFRGGKGGGSAVGGHSAGVGILRDMEKSNLAQLLGYVYLQFTPQQLDSGAALEQIRKALA